MCWAALFLRFILTSLEWQSYGWKCWYDTTVPLGGNFAITIPSYTNGAITKGTIHRNDKIGEVMAEYIRDVCVAPDKSVTTAAIHKC